ncbi:MAG: glycosyltransferase [Anaerolineales bacterium]|nr:glycosyltransferase [Anaerolineales bacterium]
MRVWYVVPYPPSLIRVRPYNLIRQLSARGHQVTVFTVWADDRERLEADALRPHVQAVRGIHMPRWRSMANSLLAVPGAAPLQSVYGWDEALLDGVSNLEAPDIIHVEHLRGARYALRLKDWRSKLKNYVPVVWDSVDCISLLFEQAAGRSRRLMSRMMTRFELGRTRRYEAWLAGQFDRVLVTSPKDQDAFRSLAPSVVAEGRVEVLPNGVALDYFTPDPTHPRDAATLVISGKMSYHANVTMAVQFAQRVFPIVKSARPDVKLVIVGKDPSAEVRALATDPAVTVTGGVPDVRPYLRQATVAAAPIAYGVGIQNKVLEAMAVGTPVVCTPQAVSALQTVDGRDLVVAESETDQAQAIVNLLNDPARAAQIGSAGRAYIERHHDWSRITERLEAIYHGIPLHV